jgi:hypothetical protein
MFTTLVTFALALSITAINTFGLIMIVEGIYYAKNGTFFVFESKVK